MYRATHKTFESYCRERWGMTRSNAYLLMRESDAAKSVEGILQNPTRDQARAVAKVEPERRQEVVEKATREP